MRCMIFVKMRLPVTFTILLYCIHNTVVFGNSIKGENAAAAVVANPKHQRILEDTILPERKTPRTFSKDNLKLPRRPLTQKPTSAPTQKPITYVPGKLNVISNGLHLSEGLQSRIVATSGQPIVLTGISSEGVFTTEDTFHPLPDGAAVYQWAETGGWIYVSNSEVWEEGGGGVSGIYFDKEGKVVDYKALLRGTTANCSG